MLRCSIHVGKTFVVYGKLFKTFSMFTMKDIAKFEFFISYMKHLFI